MDYLYVLFYGCILAFVMSFTLLKSDLLSPSVIVSGVFLISISVAVLNENRWNIVYSRETTKILLIGIVTFCITDFVCEFFSVCASRKTVKMSKSAVKSSSYIAIQKNVLCFFILCEFIGIGLYYVNVAKIVGTNMLDVQATLAAYRATQVGSVTAEDTTNVFLTFLNRFLRAYAYVSLFLFCQNWRYANTKKQKKETLALLIPGLYLLAICFINSSRGEIIKIITFVFAATYIIRENKEKWKKNHGVKYLVVALKVLAVFIPSFYVMALIMNRVPKETMMDYLSSYIGGSIQHFNQYVWNPPLKDAGTFGAESFAGVQSLLLRLGLIQVKASSHLEFRWLTATTHGNIYTFFRRPLQDFGLDGMILFTLFVGGIFSVVYHFFIQKMVSGKRKNLLSIYYCYFLPWLTMASIEQLSVSYISIGTAVECFFIMICYKIFYEMKYRNGIIYFIRKRGME